MSADNIVTLRGKVVEAAPPPIDEDNPELAVKNLMATVEEMDRGMRLMIEVIAGLEKRLRAAELALRKMERRTAPVIVNQVGQPISSK